MARFCLRLDETQNYLSSIDEEGKRATALWAFRRFVRPFPIYDIGNTDDGEPERFVSHKIVNRIIRLQARRPSP
jgi:hypothetical protein